MTFLEIKKEDVIEKCKSTIECIKEERSKKEKNYIIKKMNFKNKWRKRFFLKPKTFEEIKNYCKYDWMFPSIYDWDAYETAKRLLKSAELDSNYTTMFVDSKDVQKLWR